MTTPAHQKIVHAQVEVNRANFEANKTAPDLEYILICLDNSIKDLRLARQILKRRQRLAAALKK